MMQIIWVKVPVLASVLLLMVGCSSGADQNEAVEASFRLTTEFTGLQNPLGVVNGDNNERTLRMITDEQSLSTHWHLRSAGNGLFSIVADVDGEALALTASEQQESYVPALLDASDSDAQLWVITPLDNATCRITPFLLGGGVSLDIVNDDFDVDLRFAESGDFSGQYWSFSSLNDIPIDPALTSCLVDGNGED